MPHTSDLETALREHLGATFAGHTITAHDLDDVGRLRASVPGFRVLEVHPGPKASTWAYVTCGAAGIAHPNSPTMEFLTTSGERSKRVAHLLTMVASYHATEGLGLQHTFGLGEPWVDGCNLTAGYVSLPYPWGPALELFEHDGQVTHIYWLMPISAAERELARRAGTDALEERFEDADVAYWDLRRRSVV
ncbi:MAG: suppressor of fused domain protein [Sandaracinaceae bacterium]|nr:suppressor of fused domain protein [Myxococcales bacterium]MCB9656029.1 suppressor of fused domain protein [Sandaracinaceae bacterium]